MKRQIRNKSKVDAAKGDDNPQEGKAHEPATNDAATAKAEDERKKAEQQKKKADDDQKKNAEEEQKKQDEGNPQGKGTGREKKTPDEGSNKRSEKKVKTSRYENYRVEDEPTRIAGFKNKP